jgi:DNA helicase HerA-like ATPase
LPGMGDNFLIDFVQTSRKRGIGILLATQTPHLLPRAIMSNVNTSIVLRPTDGNFLRCVSQALDLDRDQEECLMELPDRHPRRAIVRCPGCPQPFMVELPEL